MIEIDNVSKLFGAGDSAFRALDRVSVNIRENEFFTLLGPSGCGKTTLLRMIAGFEGPTSGQILLDGQDLSDKPPYRRPVNTVFQSYALFPHMSVAENVGFGLNMLGRSKSEVAATVTEMLKLVRMTDLADRKTSEISGGQQQRVALARALAPRPKVLLLDEPLSALDFKLRKEMQLELKRLQSDTGITFVFVTHDQEEALTMSDRIAVMSAGRIRQIGGPREIYDQPADRFVADFIGDTNFLPAEMIARTGDSAQLRLAQGVEVTARAGQIDKTSGTVTLAIRPEHARLVAPDAGQLTGVLDEIVYFGTDTHYHILLDGFGTRFVLRLQNTPDEMRMMQQGDRVGVALAASAGQVLKD
ncbi:ABC transporter ATP-binding protein [Puniceibacterium sediminis]|uniref:Spermidine/putrescine import ATP-binding protein PotA n=1 Tax=Puniceibacterium sediminis TaxID=1608407 RepID=A0A238YRN1_9RHOB|nr:ABC transporter ATP-binding protein [Puniceibacterium sediminis]SNR73263.1 spermidine/putrescine transport system ATP-binding protein [Puniceibacterium sediminis]